MSVVATTWTPTYRAALERLVDFVPRAGREYQSSRNYDHGPEVRPNVSGLSPYLARRMLLEEQILTAVLAQHTFWQAEKFIQEICWRTYWKGWLAMRPAVWRDYLRDLASMRDRMADGGPEREAYAQAVSGNTGIDCFDAWAHELVEYGYLHNHSRMWFASIWIFTLRLPWVLGADFFYRHLLDADPASNTLSWRWVAGLHTRGKHYVARASNIAKFTRGRFDPRGQLNETSEPLEDGRTYDRGHLPAIDILDQRSPTAMLVTSDDLAAVHQLPPGLLVDSIVVLPAYVPLDASDPVQRFSQGAQADAADAAGALADTPAAGEADTLMDAAEWIARRRIPQVVVYEGQVGESEGQICEMESLLAERNLRLLRMRRPWDAQLFPCATKGFFHLKKRIKDVVDAAGLA